MLYPLLFTPIYKDYIWGGNRILSHLNRKGPSQKIAESWEISDRREGMSVVENGPLTGTSLHSLFVNYKKALMGKDSHFGHFPLLIKIIDAEENLSVQLHPSDKEAKTEAWVILETEIDTVIYAGFNDLYPKEEIMQKLATREILSLMHCFPAQKEKAIFIPGGRLHAIGAGSMVFEVQQNSNTTFRVYDWERGRPLHLEEAKKCLLYQDTANPCITPKFLDETPHYTRIELISTPYFIIEKWDLHKNTRWHQKENQCEILFCIEGENSLVPFGRSCLLPAECPPITIETAGSTLLRVTLP